MYNSFLCILLIYTEKRLGVLENYAGILPKTSRRFFIFQYFGKFLPINLIK